MAGLAEKEVNFKNWKLPELKKYLQAREILVSNKKKEELVELTEKVYELALKLMDGGDVNAKLIWEEGALGVLIFNSVLSIITRVLGAFW